MRFLRLFILFYFILVCLSCSKQIDNVENTPIVLKNIKYGELESNLLDVYNYTTNHKSNSILLFVHGGGWNSGDKNIGWDENKIRFFASNGFITATLNYTLSPMPIALDNPERIQHPAHIRDIAKAVKWLVNNAKSFGGNANIYLLGHSAGAQLVGLLATNHRFLKEENLDISIIKGVITLDGGAYMADLDLLLSDDEVFTDSYYVEIKYAYLNAFGLDSTIHIDACPLYHITKEKNIPPFLLIYSDIEYRRRTNEKLYQKLIEENHQATQFMAAGYDHSKILNCIGSSNDSAGVSSYIIFFLNSLNEKIDK
ncbi:MAG: alpha/beta hydrolase [Bacteroidales bacterium]|jgi:acetyl esterase/lipase|nr:alpha/beta hydrolase [Bacteroidales bacterium]